jgi:hypothetical protein
METTRYGLLRDVLALAIAAFACPLAVFGGANLGCVGQGFNGECAMAAVFISPIVLLIGGGAAGLVTRGWTGLLVVFVGVVIGMTAILLLSFGIGQPVPVGPIEGAIATIWFTTPVVIGYGMGRLAWRLFATRGDGGDAGS